MRILSIIFLIAICLSTKAQEVQQIKIINTDNTFINGKIHPDYWRLIGNVIFEHNKTKMKCDSAYHYSKTNKIIAFDNIRINKGDSIILTGKRLNYDANISYATISGNVNFKTKSNTLKTKEINFNIEEDLVYFKNYGEIIDNEKKIISKKGYYQIKKQIYTFEESVIVEAKDYTINTENMKYNSLNEENILNGPSKILIDNKIIYCEKGIFNSKKKMAFLSKRTKIEDRKRLIFADSIFYDKKNKYAQAFYNVKIIDTINNFNVFGENAEMFEKENKIVISKKPILCLIFDKDSLFSRGDKLININNENDKVIQLFNNVEFFKSDLSGICDSIVYSSKDSLISMFHQPFIWMDEYQISSDSIQLLFYNKKIDKIYLKSNPMIISKIDSLDYNQIKGKKMIGYLKKNKLNKIDVLSNGESIYHLSEDRKKIGLNYIQSTNLTLYFKNSKMNNVTYKEIPNSITTPYKEISEKQRFLNDFFWNNKNRPKNLLEIIGS